MKAKTILLQVPGIKTVIESIDVAVDQIQETLEYNYQEGTNIEIRISIRDKQEVENFFNSTNANSLQPLNYKTEKILELLNTVEKQDGLKSIEVAQKVNVDATLIREPLKRLWESGRIQREKSVKDKYYIYYGVKEKEVAVPVMREVPIDLGGPVVAEKIFCLVKDKIININKCRPIQTSSICKNCNSRKAKKKFKNCD